MELKQELVFWFFKLKRQYNCSQDFDEKEHTDRYYVSIITQKYDYVVSTILYYFISTEQLIFMKAKICSKHQLLLIS
jgi:hypothetical protein